MNIRKLGMKEDMLDDLAKSTLVMEGGYKVLTREGVLDIYKKVCSNSNASSVE